MTSYPDVPSIIIPDDQNAFTSQEANDFQLEVLTEREGVPEGGPDEVDLEGMLAIRDIQPRSSAEKRAEWEVEDGQEAQRSTWLEEDDIEEL